MDIAQMRSRLFKPLFSAFVFYLIAGALKITIIVAKANGGELPQFIGIGEKAFTLFSTLGTVTILRWLVADAPFSMLRRYTVAPLLKSIITLLIYFGAAIVLLHRLFGINLTPLLTTSAVLTGVLALSLQETLKNLFTGLWINMERIVAKGDWVRVADKEGQVMEVTWRTTRLLTRENNCIYLPNRMLAEGVLENCSHPTPLHVVEVVVGAGYHEPPNKVKEVLLDIARNTDSVLKKPEPEVLIGNFGDSSINYKFRAWIDVSQSILPLVRDDLYSKIWYAFRRNSIEIPFPVRTIHYKTEEDAPSGEMSLAALREIDFLGPLSDEELKKVSSSSRINLFGKGEVIVRQGDTGDTCYLIRSGSVDVVLKDESGDERFITNLKPGDFFGEMSLLAGDPRTATVIAREDTSCLVIASQAFQGVFVENPDLAERLSELLARRLSELNNVKSEAASEKDKKEAEKSAQKNIMNKIKRFFRVDQGVIEH
ncbi:MAG: Cyclic nucleotide-binding protein [Deltaproteobacteria bacterium]|nr:Cyclic nucleotide-binding protein [Deltaproteobacteria bacterium]